VKTLIIYHSADADGCCAGAIAYRAEQKGNDNVALHGMPGYDSPIPWEKIHAADKIVLVDFSFQPWTRMVDLIHSEKYVWWIDHHKTAVELWDLHHRCYPCPATFMPFLQDGIGACVSTWKSYHNTEVPRFVQLIGEYDVWDHHDPDACKLNAALKMFPTQPDDGIWGNLLADKYGNILEDLVRRGDSIMLYQEAAAKRLMESTWHARWRGLDLLVLNQQQVNSNVFTQGRAWDPAKYHAMCVFSRRPTGWVVSLYTDRKDVDVSEHCKAMGGGGHAGAAGFQPKEIPAELLVPVP
jgi:oligoribonuclease NrnB/cAMP/cGMP phosphodiesterase (DHH superfamily)